jgi:hypothetical protein
MGRQIAVAMEPEDELQFLAFLRTSMPIRIFRSFAPTEAELELSPGAFGHERQYFIWPTSFPWQPQVRRVAPDAPVIERRGWSFLERVGAAPVLEYDRHHFGRPAAQGRLYWAKVRAVPPAPDYDIAAFERWYADVVRWVKENGRRVRAEPRGPYYLPAALARRGGA